MLAVEAAVRGYARLFDEDEEDWGAVALLHDFDYERWPEPADHPFRGVEILKEKGYPEWVTRAILSHADYSGVPRESKLEHTLYACDEMSGFVTAAALVRPSKSVLDLEASSVVKRMKDKAFARAVSRDDLRRGAEGLGLPLDRHITNVIAFMNLIQSLFRDTPSLPVSIFWLLVILGASLWFAAVTVDRKEYVLEQ